MNRAADRQSADAAYGRLAKTCRRFLAVELNFAGYVLNTDKTEKGLKLASIAADNYGQSSAVDVLLNWTDYVKFNGDRGTQSWHECTPASLAP